MLMIRLQRIGKKKSPSYRLVLSEKTKDTQGKALENLGLYNPTQEPKIIDLKEDRIKHWLSKGAQSSATVHNLLVNAGVLSGDKKKSVAISNKRQAKMDEKNKAVEEKAAEASKASEPAEVPEEASTDDKKEEKSEEPSVEEKKEEVPAEEKKEEPAVEEKPAEAAEAPVEEKKEEAPAEEKPEEEKKEE